ncbi:SCO6880 family protein (plasmid) [Arthrobacter sp. TMP15]|uniref:SCO6880 family protein n=1 Tax=Arthrobacter sp. TMP15 TaxID=3140789 RepID=UPI0031BA52CB
MSENVSQEKFGNWLEPSSPGMFGLSLGALIVAGVGLVFTLLCLMKSLYLPALIIVAITAAVVLFGLVKWFGATLLSRLTDKASLALRRVNGETFYVTGALSTLPHEDLERLPGALVNVDTVSGRDGLGRPYSLLHHKSVHQIAAVFGCSPDGSAMQEQGVVNAQVGHFGAWVSSLSVEDGLSGATIVVDSASESSAGTCAAVRDAVSPHAPAFAKEVLDAAVGTLPARTSVLNVYSTLVWDVEALGGKGDDISSPVAEIASRLPSHTQLLDAAGAGAPKPLVEAELSHIAQLAYQPGRDQELALDALQGRQAERKWAHAGPSFFDDSRGRVVFHDGVASMTLMMTIPPGAHITAKSFDRLFGPNAKFLRKRVLITYRPVDGGVAAKTVDRLAKTADWRISTRKGRPTTFDAARKAIAVKTESDLQKGARLAMFSIMVTVTFAPDKKSYGEALNQVKSLMNTLIMPYRFVEHAGSAAFHTTLPFGVLPWKYSSKPLWMEGVL